MNGIIASLLFVLAALSSCAGTVTIGQTSVLGTADGGNANLLLGQSATLSQTATIQSMSFYVTAAVGDLVLGIYDSINGGPGHLLASTGAFTPILGWNTQAVTSPVALAPGTYWLAYFPSDNGLSFVYTNTGQWYEDPMTFSGSMPGTFVSTHGDVGNWSLYATLTPGGTPAPSATLRTAPTPSPDKTTIPPALNIVDANGDVWTLSGGVVLRNGSAAGYSANVILVAYVSGKIWQENNANLWWYWNGAMWIAGGNSLPTPTLSPSPGLGLTFFGGVQDLPTSSFDAFVRNPYTEVTQPAADALYQMVTTDINTFKWAPIDNVMAFCRANHVPFIWYCGYLNWAAGQGFPGNYGYTGAKVVTLFENLMSQAAARYPDLAQYCYFNYANEALNQQAGTDNWASAFGGKGSTGCDWVINTGKVVRKYFPTGKIGINDYNVEDVNSMHAYGGGPSRLSQFLPWLPQLRDAGVLDWIGLEGYNLDSQTTEGLTSALNQIGAYGPVIYTEFSPGSYDCFGSEEECLAAWQRLLQEVLIPNSHCMGIVGPWWRDKTSNHCGWIVDNTVSPPHNTLTMQWLQSYIPTIVH